MRATLPTPDIQLRRLVHELNTPVGVSSMAASMLAAQIDRLASEHDGPVTQELASVLEECRETLALLESSLQLCVQVLRSSAPPPDTDAAWPLIDLPATLQSAVSVCLARHPEVQVRCQLHFADRLQVHGDAGAWQQVVGNLASNSLLHGFAGRSQGSIHITGALLPDQRILVHYYDDGVGLSEQARAQLFEDGFSTCLGRGGHGLGMGITRELVHHKLNGRMQVHQPAKGVHISIEAAC